MRKNSYGVALGETNVQLTAQANNTKFEYFVAFLFLFKLNFSANIVLDLHEDSCM